MPPGDGSDGGVDLQWNYGLEPERKRLKEQDFLENNSQISSLDFLQPRSVSTGLGLSLDNTRVASTGDSVFDSSLPFYWVVFNLSNFELNLMYCHSP